MPYLLGRWLGVLQATHTWFRFYNRSDKATRVWLYLGLKVDWAQPSIALTRLEFFVALTALLAVVQGPSIVLTWTAAALFGWTLFRARGDLSRLFHAYARIDRKRV